MWIRSCLNLRYDFRNVRNRKKILIYLLRLPKAVEKKLPAAAPNNEEQQLIEKKKNNLIFFNIPESNSDSIETRLLFDFKCLSEIYGARNVKKADISNLFRVGKVTEGKDRPLVVRFSGHDITQKYCDRSFNIDDDLTIKSGNEIIKIAVAHDKTQKQRDAHRKLLEEARQLREDGAQNVVVRRSRVLTNFQAPASGTRLTWAAIARRTE